MSVRSRPRLSFLPWVEGVARQIGDPVQRLRFLRVAVPCVPAESPAQRRLRALMLPSAIAAIFFLILAIAAASLSFVKIRTTPAARSVKPSSVSPR